LTEDVPNLGFKGEWAFVKPGYALNNLVPQKKALFATDEDCSKVVYDVNFMIGCYIYIRKNY